MTMPAGAGAHYDWGTVHSDTVGRWVSMAPTDDGPIWMLNLMQYRERAVYRDGRVTTLTGKEADDLYAPLGPLAAVGASVVAFADVTAQPAGAPAFHRIGVIRYPTRAAFFAMQELPEFRELYVHKEAGMAFSIIAGCVPLAVGEQVAASAADDTVLVYRLRRNGSDGPAPDPDGVAPVARFAVDGVVMGDERTWDDLCIDRMTDDAVRAVSAGSGGVADQIVTVAASMIDEMTASLGPAG